MCPTTTSYMYLPYIDITCACCAPHDYWQSCWAKLGTRESWQAELPSQAAAEGGDLSEHSFASPSLSPSPLNS